MLDLTCSANNKNTYQTTGRNSRMQLDMGIRGRKAQITCGPGLNNKLLLHWVVLTYKGCDLLDHWPVLNLHMEKGFVLV